MSASHQCLTINGVVFGDLITIGPRVTFYTVHPQLAHLDGATFETLRSAAAAVVNAMAERSYGGLATPMPSMPGDPLAPVFVLSHEGVG